MAVTQNTYTGNGSTTLYSFTFPYLEEDEIKVSLNGTLTTAYTLANATTISFTTAPANGVAIRIYRDTNVDSLQATFFAGSAIRAQDLNDNFNQVLYSTQETVARRIDSTGGTMTGNLAFSAGKGIIFEGVTDDPHETTLLGGDPTSDRTLNLPNSSGTLVSTGDVGTVAAAMIADSNVTASKIADQNVTTPKIADSAVTAIKILDGAVTTQKISDGNVTTAKILDSNITTSKLADSNVTTAKIADSNVTTVKLADGAVTSAKIADGTIVAGDIASDAVVTSKILDQNVTTAKIADQNVTTAKIADLNVTTGKINDQAVTAAKIADGVIDSTKLTGATVVTNAEHTGSTPNDTSFFTTSASDSRYFRQDSSETITSGNPWSSSDTYVATTAAIDARVIDLVDDVGGFVPITNETSFPLTNPDINNPDGSGTIISIKEIVTTRTPASGTVTIANGAGSNTVTINGCGSTVLASGFGVLVETTSTLHTYNFHRLVPKATEVTTVAGISGDITTVATNNANVTAVAGNAANINTVAGNNANVTAVATNSTNINAVAGNATNINAVAGNAANINTVSTNIANVNNVGGSIANVNSVASNLGTVNDFAARYRVASSDPVTSLDTGDLVFNTTNNELRVYNGTAWQGGVTATGNLVSKSGDTMTGPLGVTAGTAALPSLFISGDPNTGIYSPGADQVAISTGGSGRLFVDSSGNVGVGISPSYALHVSSSSTSSAAFKNPGAANAQILVGNPAGDTHIRTLSTGDGLLFSDIGKYLAFGTNGNTERLRITSAGLVGVGTSSPSEALTVAGNIRANNTNAAIGAYGANSSSPQLVLGNSAGTIHYSIYETIDGSGNRGSLNIFDNIGSANRLTIDTSGRVGIGTSSPVGILHVQGIGAYTGSSAVAFLDGNSTGLYLGAHYDGSGAGVDFTSRGYSSTMGDFRFVATNGSFAGNTTRMVIDSSGRVGIGTTSPTNAKLVVTDGAQVTGAANDGNATCVTVDYSSGVGRLMGHGSSGGQLAFFTNASGSGVSERARIDSSGRVGIGTSSPAERLHLSGTSSWVRLDATAAGGGNFMLGSSEIGGSRAFSIYDVSGSAYRLSINSSGNVGIGSTSPGDKLTVLGDAANIRLQTSSSSSNNSIEFYETTSRRAFAKLDSSPGELQIGTVPGWATCFYTNNTERARIDSSGRLLIGRTSSQSENIEGIGYANIVQIEGAATGAGLSVANSADAARINITRDLLSDSITTNMPLGFISFSSESPTSVERARIQCDAEFTSPDERGGRLKFYTCADGNYIPTERLRIANNGAWGLAGANYGSSGQVLTSNGSGSAPSWQSASSPAALSTASGSAPSYSVRAWAVWNGSNGSVSNSGNCSSVSRSANGRYQFNFNTALPSSNYVGIGGGSFRDGTDDGNAGYVTFRRLSTAAITTAYASLMSRSGGDWPDLPLSTFMVLC